MTRINRIKDDAWVQSAFMIPRHAGNVRDARLRVFSNTAFKFTDTTLGGNFALNPPPQFTRTADLKLVGRFARPRNDEKSVSSRSLTSAGMGRKYGEMIDDNSQLVHFRFGVPQFNSITSFFTGFFDGKAAYLSKTGRAPGFFYKLGRATGFVVTIPLIPIMLLGEAYAFLTRQPSSKFYYIKPTMPLYWQSVNTIVNSIAVNMGIIKRVWADDSNEEVKDKLNEKVDTYNDGDFAPSKDLRHTKSDIALYHKYFPDIFRENGGIDVYAVANRAQRVANVARQRALEAASDLSGDYNSLRTKLSEYIGRDVTADGKEVKIGQDFKDPGTGFKETGLTGLDAYIAAWNETDAAKPNYAAADDKGNTNQVDEVEKAGSWFSNFVKFAKAELQDGGQFVTLRVNHTGAVSESFGNSTQESNLKQSINGTSADMRSKTFDVSGGNLGDGVILGAIEGIGSAVKDFSFGVLDQLNISGLRSLAGAAFVDIPEMWADSFASLPSKSYTIELRSWSGDPISRLMSLYVPLACIIAGVLPKSVGKHAYDSPFILEMYDKGRTQSRLGIITDVSISRGEGNLGWNKDNHALGINVTMTIKDLSSVIHMPLNASTGLFDHDSNFGDYMAVLGSVAMMDQIEPLAKMHLNLTRKMVEFQSWTSPSRWASMFNNTMPGQIMSGIARSTDRRLI